MKPKTPIRIDGTDVMIWVGAADRLGAASGVPTAGDQPASS